MAPPGRAQQGERMRRVGVLVPATVDDPLASAVNCASCQLPLGYSRLEITPVFRGSIAFACTMRIVVVAFF